ncbi:uncharacterized protein LOC113851937 [Abrus precatorius]|uniref:Uncharacterized protein LOC113851937 n=1 Tax=Abrus precatorius TaxID=3816 RepID=A0A8B8K2R4_ABRPR|nr:uncharacterized protein LOC113851937 [Abrus precatorius]
MVGRGRGAGITNDLLEQMTEVLKALVHNQDGEPAEYRGLSSFTRHNPTKFKGKFDPKRGQRWVADVEKIFHAMGAGKSTRHTANVCWVAPKKSGSVSTSQRPESRGSTRPKLSISGKVFAMSRAKASQFEELIRDKCVVKGRLLDVLFDSGVTHSFVSMDCVKCLNLHVTELPYNVVVTTPTGKLVVTSWLCLGCFVMVHGRDFEVDLICLPLSQLDVILGMD